MGYYKFLIYSDLIVTVVFTFEMVVKVIALGFVLHPGSHLRNSWNVLICYCNYFLFQLQLDHLPRHVRLDELEGERRIDRCARCAPVRSVPSSACLG